MNVEGLHADGFDFAPRRSGAAPSDAPSISAKQEQFILQSGAMTAAELHEVKTSLARGELHDLEMRTEREGLDAALTTEQAATMLRIAPGDLSDWRHRHIAFAFKLGGEPRYPTWQFTKAAKPAVLPGLPSVIRAFPDDMHPSSILNFMNTPQEDLLDEDDASLTPIQWLEEGHDAQDIVDILASFLQS